MMNLNLLHRYCRAAVGALFTMALALVPACKDNRPLVLVDVPLGTYAGAGTTVKVTVTLDNGQATVKTVDSAQAPSGKIGIYLPSGSSGNATVTVAVIDASGCVIAIGSSSAPVAVKAGEATAPVSISLSAAGPCVLDGGVPDSAAPVDSGVADGPGGEVSLREDSLSTGVDSLSPVVDGPPSLVDVQVAGKDVQVLDLASAADLLTDVVLQAPDAPVDMAMSDLPAGFDVGSDGAVDAPLTTLNVLANCTAYTHSTKDSTGAIKDWGIRQLAFSPDGANLISFGEDGRAKLWNVTTAGLAEAPSGLVFTGTNSVYGTISQDGRYVAVGDSNSEVTVYDLAVSIKYGAPSTKWSLPASALPVVLDPPLVIQFTTDGGHLVVAYKSYSPPDASPFAVWDLGTQKIVRLVNYDRADEAMAVLPDSYTGSMWVASVAIGRTDAGTSVSTVTLMDVSQVSPSKAQVTIDGEVYSMAFSPDGTTLAIGFYSGEVSLWDITTKSNIVRLGSPLVAGTSNYNSAYALAYTPDGKYLAAGLFDYSVRLVQLQQRLVLQKPTNFLPWSVAFSPDGLGLAVGERDNGVLLYCRP